MGIHRAVPGILLLLLARLPLFAQSISVEGRAFDKDFPNLLLQQVMVINLKTQQGVFADPDNSFRISVQKNDSIIITATGYLPLGLCFRDSVPREVYKVAVGLQRLSVTLNEIMVLRPRDLNRIEEDFKKLGYDKSDYKLTGVEAWQSPLTALYQAFSRKERSKRRVAELMNDDKRRELLREVLANYSRSGLIKIPYNEYNAFIDFLGLNDFMLQTFSQYELAIYIKNRYQIYQNM
jgi:hypothetical protein